MKIEALIERLQELVDEHGDEADVCIELPDGELTTNYTVDLSDSSCCYVIK
jgi:cobalamin biosynthesis protein CbiD